MTVESTLSPELATVIPILALRVLILGAGALICFAAAMRALFRAYNLPKSIFKTFFTGIGVVVFLLGIVILGFGIGDIFKFTTEDAWAPLFTALIGVVGVLAIFLFVWLIYKVTKYVGGD